MKELEVNCCTQH